MRVRYPIVPLVSLGIAAAGVALSACGDGKPVAVGQVVASVNKSEITVHQLNLALRGRPPQPESDLPAVKRKALDSLVEQELVVQRALQQKIDRDPLVVQSMELAKREVLARAYLDRVTAHIERPSPQEVDRFYAAKPALFGDRRVYTFQRFLVEGPEASLRALDAQLSGLPSVQTVTAVLEASRLKYSTTTGTQAAEAIPLNLLDRIALLLPGQVVAYPDAGRLVVLFLTAAVSAPLTIGQSRPMIEAHLMAERRRKKLNEEMVALRQGASIQYVGEFAQAATGAASTALPRP